MENVFCPISKHAICSPEHPALISRKRSWTYEELDKAIQGMCELLREMRVRERDKIAFIAHSTLKTILLFFALFRLKAIACPLSFRIPEQRIPEHLQALGAMLLDPESLPLTVSMAKPAQISLDQWATFLFTSGSSGNPKIACHSFGNHYFNALGAIPHLRLVPSSQWLLSLPLFHVGGIAILFRAFLCGAAVVLDNLLEKASHLSFVPTQLHRLLKKPEPPLKNLKCILLGGAPIPPFLLQEASLASLPVLITYGMTEMSSIIALSPVNSKAAAKVMPYRKVKIEKDGEIFVSGPTLFQGYWNQKNRTLEKTNDWLATKDLGKWCEDGLLEIIGRKDRQFISGGENIQPEKIERALTSIPGILKASVLPLSDEEFGMRPAAFIEDQTGRHNLDSIRSALKDRLPNFMHPVRLLPYPPELGMKPDLRQLAILLKNQE